MAALGSDNVSEVHETCAANLPAVSDSLRQCLLFDDPVEFALGDAVDLGEAESREGLAGPGLAVLFDVGETTMACLLPVSFPLPDWYAAPGESESSRLQTLALEWSMNFLPLDLEAGRFESRAVEDLSAFVTEGEPADGAVAADLTVAGDESGERWIRLVWPLTAVEPPKPVEPEPVPEPPPASFTDYSDYSSDDAVGEPSATDEFAQIRWLTVPVSVRLAQKRIDVRQLLAFTPGLLISFPKNCEEPLDLYVNNQRYARGEAVKIGEKFGLKVDEIGAEDERESRILEG